MKLNIYKSVFSILLYVLVTYNLSAQILIDENDGVVITGNTFVNQGDVNTYNASTSSSTFFWNSSWSVSGGNTIESQNDSFASIRWNNSGNFIITFTADSFSGFIQGILSVQVQSSGPTPPAAPPNPTILSQNLDNTVTLQRSGTPPSGVTWFWQGTNPFGTSTSNSSSTYVATQTGRYYINARNSDGLWSFGSGYIDINLNPIDIVVWYEDSDFDGLGDPNNTNFSQIPPPGYVQVAGDDCPTIPGLAEHNGCPPPTVLDQDENYTYTIKPQIEIDNISELNNIDALESVTYYDGLGRAKQEIAIKQSASKNDIITHIEYDDIGRRAKEHLPYVPASPGDNGDYINNSIVISGTNNYYITNYNNDINSNNPNPFSETLFEASPLNRPSKISAPGYDWRMGGGHEIETSYETNTANEVKNYQVNITEGSNDMFLPTLIDDGYYNLGELYKITTKDENHSGGSSVNDHTIEEFTDKSGRLVLKRTYNEGVPHDIYYVYDDFNNLTFVLPPKVNVNDGVSIEELNELSYQYVYDYRNRLIEKKIPGKGWEYIIYNKLDQPIMIQNAMQRVTNNSDLSSDQWLFTKYDVHGRIAYTGIANDNRNRQAIQNTVDNANTHYVIKTNQTSISIAGTTIYYSNGAYPNNSIVELHTINYYDNYNFDTDGIELPSSVYNQTITDNVNGLVTGSKVRVLDSSTTKWITILIGYDEKGRSIYTINKNNYLMTTDIVESNLDFAGKVLETTTKHTNTNDNNIGTIASVDKFYYDQAARLKRHTQKIGSNREEIIVDNTYDEIGQLISKGVGGEHLIFPSIGGGEPTFNDDYLQDIDYRYNIRRWLKAINDPNVALGDKLFAFEINYNDDQKGAVQFENLYNGNISQTIWKTANDNIKRAYSYEYDDLNRIYRGIMRKGENLDIYTRHHLRSISYDKNGNILSLQRDSNSNIMDDLSYSYDGNKLLSVTDANTTYISEGFIDGNTSGDDYEYDQNGNMTKDLNKNITNITYNHFNLPSKVSINGNLSTISYIYNARGVKMRKIVNNGTITDYAGNFVYENSSLKFFNHPEGYVEPDNNSWKYVYQYRDHLDNIRLTYADEDGNGSIDTATEIREENNYYPLGLKHKGYNFVINGIDHLYGFNRKEEQNEFNNTIQWLDLGARMMDPALGRFMTVDPMADFINYQSPYVMADNNPIRNIDTYGLGSQTPWWLRWLVGGRTGHCNPCRREGVIGFIGRQVGNLFGPKQKSYQTKNRKSRNKKSRNRRSSSSSSNTTITRSSTRNEPRDLITPLSINSKKVSIVNPDFDLPSISIPPITQEPTKKFRKPISFTEKIGFTGNSDSFIDPEIAEETLNDLIKTLQEYPQLNVLILANTSADPENTEILTLESDATLNGQKTTVGALQLARAAEVERFLISRGINWRRISIGNGSIKREGAKGRTTRFILTDPND